MANLIWGKMEGDRVVLVGHTLMSMVLVALAIIAFIENSRAAFLVWLSLLIIFIALPIVLLRFVPKWKRRLEIAEKNAVQHKKEKLLKKKEQAKNPGKHNINYFSVLIQKIKNLFKRKAKEPVAHHKLSIKGIKHHKLPETATKAAATKRQEIYQDKKPDLEKEKQENYTQLEKPKQIKLEKGELTTSNKVKTDFDRIVDYTEEKKEVSIGDVAKHFNITKEKAEQWAKILEEHDLIRIVYPTFGDAKLKAKGGK